MRRVKSILVAVSLATFCICSCEKIHEFPMEGRGIDPTEIGTDIDIKCKVEVPIYDIITRSVFSDPQTLASASEYERRYIVNIYAAEYTDTLVESHTVYREVEDVSDLLVETKLQARKYKLVVWMDYVRKAAGQDLYYQTGEGKTLNAIHQPFARTYLACSEFKDAQYFVSDIDLTSYSGKWFESVTITAPLSRPVAKITILASDFADYASSIGFMGPLSSLADDIIVDVSYDGYYPTGFNAFTGKLNDSEPGYGFSSCLTYPYSLDSIDYTRMGFDYVFVNNEKSSVTLTVRIKSSSGQFINEISTIVVPVERGKETVVIYKFFTKESVPGIGINPGFDGEFNVYV